MAGKSLAEMRADSKVRLPEWTHTLCLAQDVTGAIEKLVKEKNDLNIAIIGESAGEAGEGQAKKPQRVADPRQARIAEIDDELAVLYEEMRENEGELLMRAIPSGEWRLWVGENPARVIERDEQNRPILNALDENYTGGYCNANALVTLLRRFAVSWNGEPVTDDDWAYLIANASAPDVKKMCHTVIERMEVATGQAPKDLSPGSSGTRSTAKRSSSRAR